MRYMAKIYEKPLKVGLTKEQRGLLDQEQKHTGFPLNEIVRRLISKHLPRKSKRSN